MQLGSAFTPKQVCRGIPIGEAAQDRFRPAPPFRADVQDRQHSNPCRADCPSPSGIRARPGAAWRYSEAVKKRPAWGKQQHKQGGGPYPIPSHPAAKQLQQGRTLQQAESARPKADRTAQHGAVASAMIAVHIVRRRQNEEVFLRVSCRLLLGQPGSRVYARASDLMARAPIFRGS